MNGTTVNGATNLRWANRALWVAIALPAIFLFFAILHSAITVPFWDHLEFGRLLVRWHDGTFQWSELWAGHNHSRPFTFRVIYLINALLSDWDIRSEYAYVYAALYGAFALVARAMWKATSELSKPTRLALVAVVSYFAFSPVGHNNHWWSMMLQLDLAHFLIYAALLPIAFAVRSWPANVLAAIACWLATYTLTNGLIAFVTLTLVVQASKPNPWRVDKLTVFWLANLLVVFPVYSWGLPETGSPTRPTLVQVGGFALAYVGSPLAGFVHFPYHENFEIPRKTITANVITGAFLCLVWATMAWRQRKALFEAKPASILCFALGIFTLGSAVLTGWARAAFDEYGLANAGASRYSIFSTYLLMAIAFGLVALRPRWIRPWVCWCAFVLVTVFAINTYARSIKVYRAAHLFNAMVTEATYAPEEKTEYRLIYPIEHIAIPRELRKNLRRLKLGPYRGQSL